MKLEMGLPSYFNKSKQEIVRFGDEPSADLMPEETKAIKDVRKAQSQWIKIGIGLILLLAAIIGGTFLMRHLAAQEYQNELDESERIANELAQYEGIRDLFSERNALRNSTENAKETEINWFELMGEIDNSLPPGSSLSDFTIAAGMPTTEEIDVDALSDHMSEEEINALIAESESNSEQYAVVILMNVSSDNPLGYSEIASAIPAADAQLGNIVNDGDDNYTYTVAFGFDETIFVHTEEEEENNDE